MTMWPGGVLDRNRDNANYTCQSSENGVGPGVTSLTVFGVECIMNFMKNNNIL